MNPEERQDPYLLGCSLSVKHLHGDCITLAKVTGLDFLGVMGQGEKEKERVGKSEQKIREKHSAGEIVGFSLLDPSPSEVTAHGQKKSIKYPSSRANKVIEEERVLI